MYAKKTKVDVNKINCTLRKLDSKPEHWCWENESGSNTSSAADGQPGRNHSTVPLTLGQVALYNRQAASERVGAETMLAASVTHSRVSFYILCSQPHSPCARRVPEVMWPHEAAARVGRLFDPVSRAVLTLWSSVTRRLGNISTLERRAAFTGDTAHTSRPPTAAKKAIDSYTIRVHLRTVHLSP